MAKLLSTVKVERDTLNDGLIDILEEKGITKTDLTNLLILHAKRCS
jgi:hypothetical protein